LIEHPCGGEDHPLQVEIALPPLPSGRVEDFPSWLRLLWEYRLFLARIVASGLAASVLIAFLIPKRYDSTIRLIASQVRLWRCYRPWEGRAVLG
jgi:LPS O-antigen subunit length determinant protein (WzzB/FepE family)